MRRSSMRLSTALLSYRVGMDGLKRQVGKKLKQLIEMHISNIQYSYGDLIELTHWSTEH